MTTRSVPHSTAVLSHMIATAEADGLFNFAHFPEVSAAVSAMATEADDPGMFREDMSTWAALPPHLNSPMVLPEPTSPTMIPGRILPYVPK